MGESKVFVRGRRISDQSGGTSMPSPGKNAMARPRVVARWTVVFLISTGLAVSAQQVAPSPMSFLEEARRAEQAKDFSLAARYYSKYLAAHPEQANVWQRLGLVRYLSKKYEEALPALEKALRLDPTLWGSSVFLGISYYRVGRFEDALPPLRNALRRRPQLSEALFWAGATLFALGRYEECIVELEKISPESVERMEADYLLVKAYRSASEKYYEKIGKVDPNSYRALQLQADAFAWQGREDDAIILYRRALAQRPSLEGIHRAIGNIQWRGEKFEEAATEYEAELQINPSGEEANLRLGLYRLSRGEAEEAISHLQVALAAGNSFEANQALARAWLLRGNFEKAVASLKKAIHLNAKDVSSHQMLAEVYRRMGKTDLALRESRLAEELSGEK